MFIFILGSYDSQTKPLLHRLQESIASEFSREGHYSLLMESLQLFLVEDDHFERPVLVERTEDTLTFYVFNPAFLMNPDNLDVIDTVPMAEDPPFELRKYLIENKIMSSSSRVKQKPMMSNGNFNPTSGLFNFLAFISGTYLVIRLNELTRGGEYIELCHISKMPNRIYDKHSPSIFLFRHTSVNLTSMLSLLFTESGINTIDFKDEEDLISKTRETIRWIHSPV